MLSVDSRQYIGAGYLRILEQEYMRAVFMNKLHMKRVNANFVS